MGDEKNDFQYLVTCTYCGTQAQLSLKQLENDEPLKCRLCGAPLKIVPRPKRPAKERKRRSSDYYSLHAGRVEYERRLEEEESKVICVAVIAGIAAGFLILILILIVLKC